MDRLPPGRFSLHRRVVRTGARAGSDRDWRTSPSTATALDGYGPTWTADNSEVLFSARGGLWRIDVAGEGQAARLPFVGEDGLTPVVSRPQPGRPIRLVYVRSFRDTNIWRVESSTAGAVASSPPAVAISSTRRDDQPDVSPDGRRVAFVSDRSGEPEIWTSDTTGSNAVQLTTMNANPGFPRWSPDGSLIAFHSNPEGHGDVFVVPAAGGKPRNLTSRPSTDAFPSFSADGRWIYFGSNRTGETRIWKLPVDGGDAVPVSDTIGHAGFESPDGRDVYYIETTDRPGRVWRMPTSGGQPVKVLDGVRSHELRRAEGRHLPYRATAGSGPASVLRLRVAPIDDCRSKSRRCGRRNDRVARWPHRALSPRGLVC